MGHVDKDWRDKDDADLTSADLDAMLEAGRHVVVGGPTLPLGAVLTSVNPNLPGNVIPLRPRVFSRQAQVSAQVAL